MWDDTLEQFRFDVVAMCRISPESVVSDCFGDGKTTHGATAAVETTLN
jgi:hypothetical protein